tara:strand:+ start:13499 stop:13675 length:177 start_codon:yes stop_codon:yes gene_type:complete
MIFLDKKGQIIEITKMTYNNDKDYYRKIINTKGFILKEKPIDNTKNILNIIKLSNNNV